MLALLELTIVSLFRLVDLDRLLLLELADLLELPDRERGLDCFIKITLRTCSLN